MLVIGVGNRWRGDDGAGLEAARRLRERQPSAEVIELESDPVDLLDRWRNADDVVLIDAVRTGARPGTVHRLDPDADLLASAFAGASTHAFSVAEAIELARTLGRLPRRLRIYGIEGEQFGAGAAIGAAVQRGIDAVVDELSRATP